MTSSTESFLRRSSEPKDAVVDVECVDGVGVADNDLLGGFLLRDRFGDEGVSYGVVGVK